MSEHKREAEVCEGRKKTDTRERERECVCFVFTVYEYEEEEEEEEYFVSVRRWIATKSG